MDRFVIDVHGLRDFSEYEKDKFMFEVVPLLEVVANSVDFRERVLWYNYRYTIKTGPWYRRRTTVKLSEGFKGANGDSNSEIYEKFMSGADNHNMAKDKDLDLFLTLYYSARNVVGYTYTSIFKTWVNSKFFKVWLRSKSGQCNIVGNVIHEYMHNVGYGHAVKNNSTRKHTVPYAYGNIAAQVAKLAI